MATTGNKILSETCWSSNKEAKWKKKQQMQYVDLNDNKDVSWNFSRILARTIITKSLNTMHAEVDVFNVPN